MRRGRDSNPRCPKGHAGFQDQCNQPGSATPPIVNIIYLYDQIYYKCPETKAYKIYFIKDIFRV